MTPKVYLAIDQDMDRTISQWLLNLGVNPIVRLHNKTYKPVKPGDYEIRYEWLSKGSCSPERTLRVCIWWCNSESEFELHEDYMIEDITNMPHYAFEGAIPFGECPTPDMKRDTTN